MKEKIRKCQWCKTKLTEETSHKTIGGLCQRCGQAEAARLSKLNDDLHAAFFGKKRT